MEQKDALREFGLTEQESQVYLALLKLGGSTATILAKEVVMKRTTVYPILKSLAAKGCVLVYFRKDRRYYYAQKPNKLASLLEKKLKFFESVVPMFESMDKKQAETVGLRFIETKDELKQFYFSMLEEYKNKQYYVIGDIGGWEKIDVDLLRQIRGARAKAKIKTKMLLSYNSKRLDPAEKNLLRERRYLPEKYSFQSTMDIFNDKVLIMNPSISSIAVVIAVPAMVDIFKSMFDIIWDTVE
jgi:sugar-specific transcriptional regulator TrmB